MNACRGGDIYQDMANLCGTEPAAQLEGVVEGAVAHALFEAIVLG